jgi:hypothetical protein
MSSFRRYGGLNYASTNNFTRSFISNSDQLNINNVSGLENSKESFNSNIDMSGNSILSVTSLDFSDGTSMTTAGGTGTTGPSGAQGAQGPQGPQGATGAKGTTGARGIAGDRGARGSQGAIGAQGAQGATGTPGDIYWIGSGSDINNLNSDGVLIQRWASINNLKGSGNTSGDLLNVFQNSNYRLNFNNSGTLQYLDASSLSIWSVNNIGDAIFNTVNSTSDYRIKENIKLLDSSLYNIDNLRPVSYYRKGTTDVQIGFLAHEVQEYFPFLVTGEKDGDDTQSINYIGLIGVLTKEIQQLKTRVNQLEKKLI